MILNLKKAHSTPKEEVQERFDAAIANQVIPEEQFDYELAITNVSKNWQGNIKEFIFHFDGENSMNCSIKIDDEEAVVVMDIPENMIDLVKSVQETIEMSLWGEILELE